MRRAMPLAIAAAGAVTLLPHLAQAANSLGIGRPEQAISPDGPFAGLLFWIQHQQQSFYRLMTGQLQEMRTDGSHVWALAALSFTYGIFHAAGPGHGKAVISSYMLANEVAARRGIALAFASAFIQALTAIVVIAALALLLRGYGIRQGDATAWLEIASYGAVTALGAWLLWQKLFRGGHSHGHSHADSHHGHDRGHNHGSSNGRGHSHEHFHDHASGEAGHGHHHHRHSHEHEHGGHVHDESCGHLHAPDPATLGREFGLRQAGSAILAVGLRPCSGALIVLTFAFLNGLYAAGIASALAMALGTGVTVATLAALAVWAKDAALRIGGAGAMSSRLHRAIEIGGAALVFVLGLTLLSAALWG